MSAADRTFEAMVSKTTEVIATLQADLDRMTKLATSGVALLDECMQALEDGARSYALLQAERDQSRDELGRFRIRPP